MRTNQTLTVGITAVGVLLLSSLLPAFGLSLTPPASQVTMVDVHPVAPYSDSEIQNALNKLPLTGGTVTLEAGVYEIHRPIFLNRSGLVLQGSGEATVLHLADRANCPVIVMGSTAGRPGPAIHNLRVSDLAIDGNRKHQLMEEWVDPLNTSGIENNGIIIQAVSNSVVENVLAAHCRSGGLVTANGDRNLTVSGFTSFDNQFDGLACYKTENSVFTKLNLHDNQCAGISLDLNFDHNLISDSTLDGNDLGIFMRDSNDNQFLNLSINHSRHDGVFIAQWVRSQAKGWEYIPQTGCADNKFDGLMVRDCGGVAFCVHDPTCVNNVVADEIYSGNLNDSLAKANARSNHPPELLAVKAVKNHQ